jgi:ABC-type bacteriocin/lantibiotic exporter with double-glycine peptidase domain
MISLNAFNHQIFLKLIKKNKSKQIWFILIVILSTLIEILAIASIAPLSMVLLDPLSLNKIEIPRIIKILIFNLNISINLSFFCILFAVLIILSTILKIYLIRYQTTLGHQVGNSLSVQLFKLIIRQKYSEIAGKNTNEYFATLNLKINSYIANSLIPTLLVISSSFILISGLVLMLIINFNVTLFTFIIIFLVYWFIMYLLKDKINISSTTINKHITKSSTILRDTFDGRREIILNNLHLKLESDYQSSEYILRNAQAKIHYLGSLPRYLIELFLYLILVFVIFFFAVSDQRTENINVDLLSITAMMLLMMQRIMPQIQTIYSNLVSIIGNQKLKNDIENIYNLLSKNKTEILFNYKKAEWNKYSIKNIYFKYNGSQHYQINNISLNIHRGKSIGIYGLSGTGKSTLLDIISTLQYPESGEFFLDDKIISFNNLAELRSTISYVNEKIFFFNDSILNNITLSNDDDLANKAKDVLISLGVVDFDYFFNNIKDLYKKVGDGVTELSAGQRQRIGLARAIYQKPSLLILDEATNAIDIASERKIIDNIRKTFPKISLIIVSHRKETLYSCDKIYEFLEGYLIPKDLNNFTENRS